MFLIIQKSNKFQILRRGLTLPAAMVPAPGQAISLDFTEQAKFS